MAEKPFEIPRPTFHKAKVCVWTDLTYQNVEALDKATSSNEIKLCLANIFNLSDYKENMKTAILLDLYFYIIKYARSKDFNREQTSALFSIVKKTHEACIETPFGNIEECFRYMKELVLRHVVLRPPFSINLFNPDQAKAITEYITHTYFRHFKLYKYVFTPHVTLDIQFNYIGGPIAVDELETESPYDSIIKSLEEGVRVHVTETQAAEEVKPIPPVSFRVDSPTRKELQTMISNVLDEQLKNLHALVDQQLKTYEETINRKLQQLEEKPVIIIKPN